LNSDPAAVAKLLSSLLVAPFKVARVPDSRTTVKREASWFVWCPDLAYARNTGHLKYAWADRDRGLWLESSELGDTIRLIEREYGEDAANELVSMDLSGFEEVEGRRAFNQRYPIAAKLFRDWQGTLDRISKERGVDLQLRFDSGKDVVIYLIGARIKLGDSVGEKELEQIRSVEKTLKEACDEVLSIKADG
jgi:hypothetical protein